MANAVPLVVFDFDGTLTCRSTFLPFLLHLCGNSYRRLARRSIRFIGPLIRMKLGLADASEVKQRILTHLLGNIDRHRLADICRSFVPVVSRMLIPEVYQILESYVSAGCTVVIASASLAEWIAPWAEKAGVSAVLATRLRFDSNGFPVAFDGLNCKGIEKARRLRKFISALPQAPSEIIGYGNLPDDIPMLQCCDKSFVIKTFPHVKILQPEISQ